MYERFDYVLIRHAYDDQSYIDGKNDTGLTAEGVSMAQKRAGILSKQLGELNTMISIYSSAKKRTMETAEIIADRLNKDGVSYTFSSDKNINELYQGKMLIDGLAHDDKAALMHHAWIAFNTERATGNYNYRFGQPHPLLLREFVDIPYGETHNEYALRVAQSFKNYMRSKGTPLIVLHGGGIGQILNLTKVLNTNPRISAETADRLRKEKFYRKIEFCEVFSGRLDNIQNSLNLLSEYINILQTDIINANNRSK